MHEYTTVCDKCGKRTWDETVCATGTLKVIDKSDLNPRATPFYTRQERVEIVYKDDEKRRCWVGRSSGWRPVYLEIIRRNSSGGMALYLPDDAVIRGLGVYK